MCIFSRSVPYVGRTKIFARDADDGRQFLAYSMDAEIPEDLAMVLPLPARLDAEDGGLSFIDLSGYPALFSDLATAFPPPMGAASAQSFGRGDLELPLLPVHDVGAFEASFVPTQRDFARVDPRFQLPPQAWSQLPSYAESAFAVFRLRPMHDGPGTTSKRQTVHPMAFSFLRKDPTALFFPTTHLHDGTVPDHARFDHLLFAQASPLVERLLGWTRSFGHLGSHLTGDSVNLVDGHRGGSMTSLYGHLPNRDVVIEAPSGVTLQDLSGEGEHHRFEVSARWAFELAPAEGMHEAWSRTSKTKLSAICRGLATGLPVLTAKRRDAWRLGPVSDALLPHFMNGPRLWTGSSYIDGRAASSGGPGAVRFTPFTPTVEPQSVTLAFREIPDEATLAGIQTELCQLLAASLH